MRQVFDQKEPGSDLLRELRQIWDTTSEESVAGDLERARELVQEADPAEQETAQAYLQALERLGRWLHDR